MSRSRYLQNDISEETELFRAMSDEKLISIAEAAGFQPFISTLNRSTPINSGPYLLKLRPALDRFNQYGGRQKLTSAFTEFTEEVKKLVQVEAVMLGGSYIDCRVQYPKDIDGLVYYRLEENDNRDRVTQQLEYVINKYKRMQLDLRVIPLDVQPWVFIKMTAFFVNLYSSRREAGHNGGSVVLLP